jgi:hypothetical protein
VHSVKLKAKGNAPDMFLVTVVQETPAADGTLVSSLDQTFVTCHGPGGAV